MPRKLFSIWWLVLLRGLVECALPAAFFLPELQSRENLTYLVAGTAFVGGLLEIGMFLWLRGHPFQGMLRLSGIAGVLLGGYLFFTAPATIGLLLTLTGLWMAVRGFTGLWIGLSIVTRPIDQTLPTLAGVVSLLIGLTAMLFLRPEPPTFILLITLYGLGSVLVHLATAVRMRLVGSLSP